MKEKDYEITINTEPFTVEDETVTHKQIALLAYPELENDPKAEFSITYENAHSKPKDGTLGETATIEVKKKGTIFDVTPTNRS